jgi:ketosteroid isomerase-like protein
MENNPIEKFYSAFAQKDWRTMQSCYHQDVVFEDPAFGQLNGDDARKMWKMLCEQGNDLELEYSNVQCSKNKGTAHWEARYTFSKTGRKVHNIINATFELKDGLIVKHTDNFNLHKWAGQALGWSGKILGGTNLFKKKLHAQTNAALRKYR